MVYEFLCVPSSVFFIVLRGNDASQLFLDLLHNICINQDEHPLELWHHDKDWMMPFPRKWMMPSLFKEFQDLDIFQV